MEQNYDLSRVTDMNDAQSWGLRGGVDHRYYLFHPDQEITEGDTEFLVLENPSLDMFSKEFDIKYRFTAYYTKKCMCAISMDGERVCIGYSSKFGVACYDCRSAVLLWQDKKIKSISKVRFNRFRQDIIEIIHKDLSITYVHAIDGSVLTQEEQKEVHQFPNYVRLSENGAFVMTADYLVSKRDIALYSVYEAKTQRLIGKFQAQFHLNERCFCVTNDGKYAFCLAYQNGGVSMYEVSTGNEVWNLKKSFLESLELDEKNRTLYINLNRGGVYKCDMDMGEHGRSMNGNKIIMNKYGDPIIFQTERSIRIAGKSISSMGFAFFRAAGTTKGIVLISAGKGLQNVDYKGNILWENKEIRISSIAYLEDEDVFCGYNMTTDVDKIYVISAKTGEILCEKSPDSDIVAFMDNNTKVLSNTGEIYDITSSDIQKSKAQFLFSVV